MTTRRQFLTGLLATTTLVATPIAVLSEADRHARILALVEAKMNEVADQMIRDMTKQLWGDSSTNHGGLADLLSVDPSTVPWQTPEMETVPEYEWKTWQAGFTVS